MPDRDQLRQARESVRRIREADTPPLHGCESWIDYATHHQHVGTMPCWQCAARDRAMAERDEMGARIDDLRGLVAELADGLEARIRADYESFNTTDVHPSLRPSFDRDMEPVERARKALGGES